MNELCTLHSCYGCSFGEGCAASTVTEAQRTLELIYLKSRALIMSSICFWYFSFFNGFCKFQHSNLTSAVNVKIESHAKILNLIELRAYLSFPQTPVPGERSILRRLKWVHLSKLTSTVKTTIHFRFNILKKTKYRWPWVNMISANEGLAIFYVLSLLPH